MSVEEREERSSPISFVVSRPFIGLTEMPLYSLQRKQFSASGSPYSLSALTLTLATSSGTGNFFCEKFQAARFVPPSKVAG